MSPVATEETLGQIISLRELQPSPLNPRKRFDDATMAELTANVAKNGVIVPLIVRGREIIDGERRYRAATLAGLSHVPVIFKNDLSDGEVIELMLLNQLQRQDLTPLEEAQGFKALIASNPSHYSAAYIADRIGRSEKWVWDRMKLLDLVPLATQLLEAELILVGHAEVLAKLKPEDQLRAIGDVRDGIAFMDGGLFERAASRLGFDETSDYDEDDDEGVAVDPLALYRAFKTRTVKELEAWISRHVRFDLQHAAVVAPLDFGAAALKVEEAESQPGRGKKVVEITFEYQVPPDARGDGEGRILASRAWKRADGSSKDAAECEYRVLGVVAAGRQYGRAFEVCIAKDKCQVHWKDEIKAREKNAKLRAKGHGSQAAQNEVVDNAKQREKEERERQEHEARAQQWQQLEPLVEADAIAQVKKFKVLTSKQAEALNDLDFWRVTQHLKEHLGASWFKLPTAVVFGVLLVTSTRCADFDDYVTTVAKPAGLDIKRLEAIRDKQFPKKAAPKAEAKKPAAKKAKKR